jgi:hypothetical protein
MSQTQEFWGQIFTGTFFKFFSKFFTEIFQVLMIQYYRATVEFYNVISIFKFTINDEYYSPHVSSNAVFRSKYIFLQLRLQLIKKLQLQLWSFYVYNYEEVNDFHGFKKFSCFMDINDHQKVV